MALTDTALRAAKPAQRRFKILDRNGLFLLVNPAGSKLCRWRYRFAGREKLMALGEYPSVMLTEARERHLYARKLLASGADAMAERKAKLSAGREQARAREREAERSFEKIAVAWWDWWSVGKSARHAAMVWRRLQADVLPAFGHKFADAVTAADIRDVVLAIERRHARDAAKRAHQSTGQIFRIAIARGLATRNPAAEFKPRAILDAARTDNWPGARWQKLHQGAPGDRWTARPHG